MKKLNLNIIVSKFKEKLKSTHPLFKNQKTSLVFFVLALGFTAFLVQMKPELKTPTDTNTFETPRMDTYIPEDKTLIPIKVVNYESLDQIIGKYGVVDLYTAPEHSGQKSRLIATSVRLLNISENEGYFNVLIPWDQAPVITGHTGEFVIGVRNPKLVGTQIVKEPLVKKKRRVLYATENQ